MLASISGIKFNDLNFNGVQDEAEEGLAYFAIVHGNEEARVSVLAVLIEEGEFNEELALVFDTVAEELAVSGEFPETIKFTEEIELTELLPGDTGSYYNASLTTPPFSEGLNFFVYEDTIEVSSEQMEVFADFLASIDLESNNRELQELNERQFNELNFQLTLGEESVTDLNFATTPITEVIGGAGKDILTGTDGFDLIIARDEADKLYGFAGNDTLEGDAGRDTLSGGAGNDVLTGGSEQDMFVIAAGKDADLITDFEPGVDYFFGADQLSFEDLSFVGNSILLEETSEILATVGGVDTTTLTPGDFLTFYTPLQCCQLLIA